MDLAKIRKLLAIVADSDVAEVEIEEEGFKVVVRKASSIAPPQPPPVYPPLHLGYYTAPNPDAVAFPMSPASEAMGQIRADAAPPADANPAPAAATAPQEAEPAGEIIRAPIVGTFYRSPSPDSDPFVRVGDRVQPGDVLCIIEAMKLMNEIECETSGVIKRVFAENAEPVEFDQPLFLIEAE